MTAQMEEPPGGPPLSLHQVLEEEYERLHGKLPPGKRATEEAIIGERITDPGKRSERRLKSVFADIHEAGHAALCLSGGGIRSATFGLGVLQGLARCGLLDKFHYVSTVSGGGYVGSWLSAWIHRHERGVAGVTEELRKRREEVLRPEPDPVLHLRNYSNYLTPSLGFFSTDTWSLAAIVLRNLVLNWLVVVPLMLVVLLAPRLALALARPDPLAWSRPWLLGLTLLVSLACGVTAIAYVGIKRPSLTWDYNGTGGFLRWCLLPLLVSATGLSVFWVWYRRAGEADARAQVLSDAASLPGFGWLPQHDSVPFVAFGVALYLAGWLIYSAYHGLFSFWDEEWKKRLRNYRFSEPVAVLLSGAVGGLFLWLVAAFWLDRPDFHYRSYVAFSAPLYLLLFLAVSFLFAGVTSEYTNDEDREWWARFSAWVLIAMIGWGVLSGLVLIGPEMLLAWREEYVIPAGGLAGLLTTYLAHSAKAPPSAKDERHAGLRSKLMAYGLPLGALVFIALLIVLLSLATNYLLALVTLVFGDLFPRPAAGGGFWRTIFGSEWWLLHLDGRPVETLRALHMNSGEQGRAAVNAPAPLVALLGVLLALGGRWLSRRINTNKFSYHAMYRNRLIRAYLGASRGADRDPHPFTGFDQADNIPMHELRPEMFHPGSFVDIGRFVKKLKEGERAEYGELLGKLSPETRKYVEAHDPDKHHPKKVLRSSLIEDLNGHRFVLKEDSLHNDFAGFADEMERWLDDPPKDPKTVKMLPGWDEQRLEGFTERTRALLGKLRDNDLRPDELVLINRLTLERRFPGDFHTCLASPHRPLHVINIALNLVSGKNLAWQDRKAESFTVSPLHCGSCQIPDFEDDADRGDYVQGDEGDAASRAAPPPQKKEKRRKGSYRPSRFYGGHDTGGISLGTAMAVSGAAVSPNMGYYSSPLVTFLMTLFNVRLGWWLGNPGTHGKDYYYVANPKSSAYPIVAEALGLTTDENSYVYLSDGGHFENLGLYEMVLRRCKTIVVSDASDDYEFKYDNLGNAVRKIRIDFGIPIEFERVLIYPRSKGSGGAFCAIGHIRYSLKDGVADGAGQDGGPRKKPVEDGLLVYIKPVFYGAGEPVDVHHYARANERFPHESTVDQWFSEEQFESYRSLGEYIVSRVTDERHLAEEDKREGLPPLEVFRKIVLGHVGYYKGMAEQHEARPGIADLNSVLQSLASSIRQGKTAAAAAGTERSDGFTG